MILTNAQIFDSAEPINELLKHNLSIKVSFTLLKNAARLNEIFPLINKQKDALVTKYTKLDDSGQPIKGTDEKGQVLPNAIVLTDGAEFTKELNELFSVENEVDVKQINIKDIEHIVVPPSVVGKLQWMIIE